MIYVNDNCKKCGSCEEICLVDAVKIGDKKAEIDSNKCVECGACVKVCKFNAIELKKIIEGVICENCPIQCIIKEQGIGACQRYKNEDGEIKRVGRIVSYEEIESIVREINTPEIDKPLITGIGAGTTYPDFKPSPLIVKGLVNGVDVVTVVTEAPLSYSGITLKIDTDRFIGDEGKKVYIISKGKKYAGHVCREEYGSKMISIGGVNILTGKDGLWVAKFIFDILRGKRRKIVVEDGAEIEVKLNEAPVINGEKDKIMRIGCGSATLGLFAPYLKELADEVIVLDGHIVGLLTEHAAGRALGLKYSGIKLNAFKSTPGRYFVEKGDGWGGTNIKEPLKIVNMADSDLNEGLSLLILDTTATNYAFYKFEKGEFKEVNPTDKIKNFIKLMRENCEKSKVTAIFSGGVGGSARAGVTKNPIKLTQAVHSNDVRLTIGGAKPFIYPGGGINFIVDLNKILHGSIYLSPTPSFIVPIEFTMTEKTFKEIGGHIDYVVELRR